VWGRTEIWFAWDIESFGTEWLTLYGDFFSGGPVTGGDWHISSRHGEPRFVGSVNPHAVPEPSTLAALIAGCLALAIGRRSGVL
jgi:hypothetical protein